MSPIPPNTPRLKMGDVPAGSVVFTHSDEDTDTITVYSIDHLHQEIARQRLEPSRLPVDRKFAKYIGERRGIERHRLNRVKRKHLETPILCAQQPDGSVLIVDGHHRYLKAANLMKRTVPGFILPIEVWWPCTIEDHGLDASDARDIHTTKSGIS